MSHERFKPHATETPAAEVYTEAELNEVIDLFASRPELPLRLLTAEQDFRKKVASGLIARAEDLDEIQAAIRQIGEIQGSRDMRYQPGQINGIIERIKGNPREADIYLTFITATYGIRSRVEELLVRAGVYTAPKK